MHIAKLAFIGKTPGTDNSEGKTNSSKIQNKGEISANRIDLTGQKYGRLTVIEMLYSYKNNQTHCRCTCTCGKTTIVLASSLKSGRTKSCGCLEAESRFGRKHGKYKAGDTVNGFTLLEETDRRTPSQSIVWKCMCTCGNIVYDSPSNIKHANKKKCEACYVHPLLIDLTGERYGMLTVVEQFPERLWSGKRVAWKCRCDCGKEIIASASGLRDGSITSCGCKNKSIRIYRIMEQLNSMGLEYTTEHRFKDCADVKPLPFDIYLAAFNTVIEYDGRQHFEAVEYWGGQEGLTKRNTHDRIKDEYCKGKGIRIIRIPYYMTDEEIQRIIDELEPVTSKCYAEQSA